MLGAVAWATAAETAGRTRMKVRVFLFLNYLFFDFSKYISQFFLQIWTPVASSTGGKSLPPDGAL